MLKKTIPYTDYNEQKKEATLWFNLSRARLLDNLDLEDHVKKVMALSEGEKRDLTKDEVRLILDLVKALVKLSYGVRSEDGERFNQKPEVWEAFEETAVYDELLLHLFQNIDEAYAFIVGILPKDFREQAESQLKETRPELFNKTEETVEVAATPENVTEDDRPAWLVEGRPPTNDEFMKATDEQKMRAFALKNAQS